MNQGDRRLVEALLAVWSSMSERPNYAELHIKLSMSNVTWSMHGMGTYIAGGTEDGK